MYNLHCESNLGCNELLSVLCLRQIPFGKLTKSEKGCRFRIEKEYFLSAQKAVAGKGNIVVIDDRSFAGILKKCGARAGIFCGLILFLFALTVYSLAVTRLEIVGNELVSEEIIFEKVSNIITFPIAKESVDSEKIAFTVMKTDGIALAKAEIVGNVLRVTVTEELPGVPSLSGDIVAEENGVIEKTVTGKGTCLVREGDSVKKGQTLIRDDGEGASGKVVYTAYLAKRYVFGEKSIQKVRTGREETFYLLPGTKADRKTDFELYEREETDGWFSTFFPLYVRKVTLYEVEEREIAVDAEKRKRELLLQDGEQTEKTLPTNFRKIKSWFWCKTVDKNTFLDIYYQVEITSGR